MKLSDKIKKCGKSINTIPLMCTSVCVESSLTDEALEKCLAAESIKDHWFWCFFVTMPILVYLIDRIIRKKVSFKHFCLMFFLSFLIYLLIVLCGRPLFPVFLYRLGHVLFIVSFLAPIASPIICIIYGIVFYIKNKKKWHPSWPWIVLPLLILFGLFLAGFSISYC